MSYTPGIQKTAELFKEEGIRRGGNDGQIWYGLTDLNPRGIAEANGLAVKVESPSAPEKCLKPLRWLSEHAGCTRGSGRKSSCHVKPFRQIRHRKPKLDRTPIRQ